MILGCSKVPPLHGVTDNNFNSTLEFNSVSDDLKISVGLF